MLYPSQGSSYFKAIFYSAGGVRSSVSNNSLAEEGELLYSIPDVQIFHISAAVRIFYSHSE
jgi:hypothetical protein